MRNPIDLLRGGVKNFASTVPNRARAAANEVIKNPVRTGLTGGATALAAGALNKQPTKTLKPLTRSGEGYQDAIMRQNPGAKVQTTSLAGTPTSTPATQVTAGTDRDAQARQYLQDESAASLAMGSKNLVQAMRGNAAQTAPEVKTDMQAAIMPKTAMTSTSVSRGPSVLDQLRSKVGSLAAPSASEAAMQDELAQFRGDAEMGINRLSGQGRGIPLELIRGQKRQLGEQAGIEERTLLNRIAAASAQREAALTAAKTELGYATADQERQDKLAAQNRQTVGNSIIQYNPETGTYDTLYTAPQESAAVDTDRYASSGGVIYDKQTGDIVNTLPQDTSSGGFTIGNTRYNADGSVLVQGSDSANMTAAQQTDLVNISTAEQTIDSLLAMAGSGNIAGLGLFQGRLPAATLSAEGQQARAMLGTIRSQIAKANAGTSFTDTERQLLEESLPTPTDSDSMLLTKLNTLKTMLGNKRDAIYQVTGGSQTGGGDEIDQFLDSFSNAGRAVSGSAASIAAAIKQVESGGNYNARGGSGESGAYQFMPSTWKSWAQTYLGNANAPMTPENQDKVAQAKIQDWLNQGYTPEQVALSWNAGSPKRVKGVNRFGVAYDSGAYADKVLGALNNLG